MGKGSITSGGDNGQYSIASLKDIARVTTRLAAIDVRLAEMVVELVEATTAFILADNALIAAYNTLNSLIDDYATGAATEAQVTAQSEVLSEKQVLWQKAKRRKSLLTLEEAALVKEKSQLTNVDETEAHAGIWCCDLSESLSGEVGTIEIPGEIGQLLVRPGFADGAAYDADRDGILQPSQASSAAGIWWNWAMLPGWQKWMPFYRTGTLSAIDYDLDTGTVTFDTERSSQQNLNVNAETALTGVPIQYMDCDSAAFNDGDAVVVSFAPDLFFDPNDPYADYDALVIGFKSNPKPCEGVWLCNPRNDANPTGYPDPVTSDVTRLMYITGQVEVTSDTKASTVRNWISPDSDVVVAWTESTIYNMGNVLISDGNIVAACVKELGGVPHLLWITSAGGDGGDGTLTASECSITDATVTLPETPVTYDWDVVGPAGIPAGFTGLWEFSQNGNTVLFNFLATVITGEVVNACYEATNVPTVTTYTGDVDFGAGAVEEDGLLNYTYVNETGGEGGGYYEHKSVVVSKNYLVRCQYADNTITPIWCEMDFEKRDDYDQTVATYGPTVPRSRYLIPHQGAPDCTATTIYCGTAGTIRTTVSEQKTDLIATFTVAAEEVEHVINHDLYKTNIITISPNSGQPAVSAYSCSHPEADCDTLPGMGFVINNCTSGVDYYNTADRKDVEITEATPVASRYMHDARFGRISVLTSNYDFLDFQTTGNFEDTPAVATIEELTLTNDPGETYTIDGEFDGVLITVPNINLGTVTEAQVLAALNLAMIQLNGGKHVFAASGSTLMAVPFNLTTGKVVSVFGGSDTVGGGWHHKSYLNLTDLTGSIPVPGAGATIITSLTIPENNVGLLQKP